MRMHIRSPRTCVQDRHDPECLASTDLLTQHAGAHRADHGAHKTDEDRVQAKRERR